MNTDPGDALAPAAARLVELARESFTEMSAEQRVRGGLALRSRLESERKLHLQRSGGLAALALGMAVAAIALIYIKGQGSNLSVQVDGGSLEPGGLLRAKGAESTVHFSDGSEVVLGAEGQLHVRSLEEHGAHITLDAGRVHVYVVHEPHTHWEFAAGPFVVDVSGTAFGLSWSGATQELDLQLENGAVKVSGPVLDGSLSLRAGQWLTVRQGDLRIRTLGAHAAPSADESAAASLEDPVPTGESPAVPTESVALPAEATPSSAPAPSAFGNTGSSSSSTRMILGHRAQ